MDCEDGAATSFRLLFSSLRFEEDFFGRVLGLGQSCRHILAAASRTSTRPPDVASLQPGNKRTLRGWMMVRGEEIGGGNKQDALFDYKTAQVQRPADRLSGLWRVRHLKDPFLRPQAPPRLSRGCKDLGQGGQGRRYSLVIFTRCAPPSRSARRTRLLAAQCARGSGRCRMDEGTVEGKEEKTSSFVRRVDRGTGGLEKPHQRMNFSHRLHPILQNAHQEDACILPALHRRPTRLCPRVRNRPAIAILGGQARSHIREADNLALGTSIFISQPSIQRSCKVEVHGRHLW